MTKMVEATLREATDGSWEVLMSVSDLPDRLYVFPSQQLAEEGLWRAVHIGEDLMREGHVTKIQIHGELGAPVDTMLYNLAEVNA